MGFKLNIGKDGGGGSTGFSLKQSLNMIKAKGMSSQMVGTDVMKDGYYNQVNKVEGIEGGGSGINMNVPGPMYLTEEDKDKPAKVDSANELLRDGKGNVDDDAKVTEVDVNMGRGGKGKGEETTRTIRRVKGDDKPNADRYGVGRIGTEKTLEYGSMKKTKTNLPGAKGFVKSGPKKGMVIEDEVNEIKPRGIQRL